MSLVLSQVQRIDAQLDRIQLAASRTDYSVSSSSSTQGQKSGEITPRTSKLQATIKALSVDPSSSHLLSPGDILWHLRRADFSSSPSSETDDYTAQQALDREEGEGSEYERELEWLAVAKATTQVYGLVIDKLLSQTVGLADDLWYWDGVISSQSYTLLYSVQTAPGRMWEFGKGVWEDVKDRASGMEVQGVGEGVQKTLRQQWSGFYRLVQQVVRERNVRDMRRRVVSPVARIRSEVRAKQARLKQARLRGANALGVLLGEGLMNESVHGDGLATPGLDDAGRRWKVSMARSVALMEAVLVKTNQTDLEVDKFDAAIAEETDDDMLYQADVSFQTEGNGRSSGVNAGIVANRLERLIAETLEAYDDSSRSITKDHGKPSRLIRYWLPVTMGILSSSTVLRILINRKAEIRQWIEELGSTMIDFWSNWVVEPTRKVIKTIRHDEGSEVSIMSKRSLEGDRDSLERMVVEFARDNPAGGKALTDVELADIRSKVREGDLTTVLKAYEHDLSSPFMGVIRGNLIRALLIQVQKTKVDVEVAMGGIDALLKSQELVFGFVGLTPGVLVSIAVWRWLRSSFTDGRNSQSRYRQGVMIRQLRNIDRVLDSSEPTSYGELLYKDHGLLLCEVHVLRQEARRSMPDEVYREFLDELEELVDVRSGVKRQKSVVERVRWAYGRWF